MNPRFYGCAITRSYTTCQKTTTYPHPKKYSNLNLSGALRRINIHLQPNAERESREVVPPFSPSWLSFRDHEKKKESGVSRHRSNMLYLFPHALLCVGIGQLAGEVAPFLCVTCRSSGFKAPGAVNHIIDMASRWGQAQRISTKPITCSATCPTCQRERCPPLHQVSTRNKELVSG